MAFEIKKCTKSMNISNTEIPSTTYALYIQSKMRPNVQAKIQLGPCFQQHIKT